MTLTGSKAIRQSEVLLTLYPATESCSVRENLRKDNKLAYSKKPRFTEDPQPGPSSKM
jgi:hypothetical protein